MIIKDKYFKLNIIGFCLLLIFCIIFNFSKSYAKANDPILIDNIEFENRNAHNIDLLIKTSTKPNFKVYVLKNPWRLVIDIENADLNFKIEEVNKNFPKFVNNLNTTKNHSFLKLEFSLTKKIIVKNSNYENQNNSIIVKIDFHQGDLDSFLDNIDQPSEEFIAKNNNLKVDESENKLTPPSPVINNSLIASNSKNNLIENKKNLLESKKIPIIVIDSGHGGKDPGTIGNKLDTKEKDITLAYSKELYKILKNNSNFKVYLTRNSDDFISLKKRIEIARKKKADLFISLHANAINDEDISGFSIYTLSEQSSDKQAELLAKKENQADIINGVDFSQASVEIMKTLIDLSQRSSKNLSAIFANKVIKHIKNNEIEIIQNTHRFAGFAVLTAPDMASVLIELGYLSNPDEEKLLNNSAYKKKICESITNAIEEYFSKINN